MARISKALQTALQRRGTDADAVQFSQRGGVVEEWDEIATKAADSVTDEERIVLPYVISDETVDRHGDTVSVDGWELKHYQNVVLWAHNSDIAPVAKALRTYKHAKQLRSVAAFTTDEENAFGASIGRLSKAGFVPAASVGFIGLEGTLSKDEARQERYWLPIDYTAQELIEWSTVNIGSNRSAVRLGFEVEAAKGGGHKSEIMRLVDWALQQSNVPPELEAWCKDFFDSGKMFSLPASEKSDPIAIEPIPPSIERLQLVDLGKFAQEILNG